MDSLRGQRGIQMLLNAEQEAGRIVSAARTGIVFSLFYGFLAQLLKLLC